MTPTLDNAQRFAIENMTLDQDGDNKSSISYKSYHAPNLKKMGIKTTMTVVRLTFLIVSRSVVRFVSGGMCSGCEMDDTDINIQH